MAEKSRTDYSARNTTVAMAARIIAILSGYLTRVVFTHTLSEAYVGINGLFTDILNVLALSELGVGTAITYALYQPIARGDVEKQKSLMRLYRKFYRIVAVIVLAAGLMVIPFFEVLIRDGNQVEHLLLIYLMYLSSSVVSYLMIYKRTLVDAHQLSYIGVLYQTVFLIFQNLVQIGILYFTGNFILFLAVLNLCTLGGNLAISRKADRMYPYLKEKTVQELTAREKKDIFQNIRAMLMHKVGNVLVNNTDNLLLSSLVGTLSVGRYSNYYLIIGSVCQVLNQMFQGITASVGNLGVEESREHIRKIFEAAFFMGQWMFGLAAICLFEAIDPFVSLSFGAQYVFPGTVTLVLCLNFYLTGMRQAVLVFRDSMGIFRFDRYKAIPEAVINLVVSFFLGRRLGALGIFLGTMASTVATSLWVEPYMFYKHRLETSSRPYFLKYLLYAGVTFLLWWGEDLLCRRIEGNLWTVCVLRLALCFVLTNLVFLLLYHRTREFRLLWKKAVKMARDRLRSQTHFSEDIQPEEEELLELLCHSLEAVEAQEGAVSEKREEGQNRGRGYDPEKLCLLARRHGVLPLLYDSFEDGADLSEHVRREVETAARKAVCQNYRILFLSKYTVSVLKAAGIPSAVLKGVATASCYPVPELRKTGDVDLLLFSPEHLEKAVKTLEKHGMKVPARQPSLHHVICVTEEGIEVELHSMLAEPFDNQAVNRYLQEKLQECAENIKQADCMGVELPILDTGYHAYELLLHMLQHFLRAGFGLRLLCDWVVFWNRETEEQERQKYLRLVGESGLKGFSDMVTLFCRTYLGLKREQTEWMEIRGSYNVKEFLRDTLDAEEFGHSSADRMVIPRKNSLPAYVREFHHQMHLNFPKAGGWVPLWPVLWIITLWRFLRNNRKIRDVSARAILKKAGQRSRLLEQIGLWKQ